MKLRLTSVLTATLLFTAILFTACTKDDNDNAEPSDDYGPIKGLTASLSMDNGEWITLDWEEIDLPYYGRYEIFRSVDGSEFTNRGDADKTHFWDPQTERNTTYSYYVNYKESYSDTIEITTAPVNQPFAHAMAYVTGEGDEAVLEYIIVNWKVGSEDDINSYGIYRDGELISTEPTGNNQSYKDYDNSLNFGQEYTYVVVANTNSGGSIESFDCYVTPKRPDAVDRPAPEILSITSNRETKEIDVLITDESQTPNNLIHYKGELEDLNYSWDYQVNAGDLASDEDGNLIIGLSAEGADLPTNQAIWLRSRVRIYVEGDWSDWSDVNRWFVF